MIVKQWWQVEKERLADAIYDFISKTQDQAEDRNAAYRRYLAAYMNADVERLTPNDSRYRFSDGPGLFGDAGDRVTMNIIQSAADTTVAMITINKPLPMVLTDDGDWNQKQRAKLMEKFIEGVFYKSVAFKEGARAFLDAAIFGTGFVKVFSEGKKICVERVFPSEIIIDETAGMFTEPRTIMQRKYVSAEVLINTYGEEFKDQIYASVITNSSASSGASTIVVNELVEVIEAWHLPSGQGAKDGRHTICINKAVLHDEPWNRPCFPFAVIRWARRPMGFFGQGLAERLYDKQRDANHFLNRVSQSLHMCAVTYVVTPRSAKLKEELLTNENATILEYDGAVPPQIQMPNSVAADLYQYPFKMRELAYEDAGISQQSATSQRSASELSGIALRTLNDMEARRFATQGAEWENLFLEVAKLCIEEARAIGGVEVMYVGKENAKKLTWTDVQMEEDAYVLKMFPTNLLPTTPAGRLATVKELSNEGFIQDKRAVAQLLDFPDVSKMFNDYTAQLDLADKQIAMVMDGRDDEVEPNEYQDLKVLVDRATVAMVRAEHDGAPRKSIDALLNLIQAAEARMAEQQPAPAAPEAQQPAPPPGPGIPGMGEQ